MKMEWLSWKDDLEQSYWFIPSVMAASAILLAFLSLHFEGDFNTRNLGGITWIYTRDAQGARELLSTVGGSLITVTGVLFSITLVALTNASTQFGTRIMRTFARDTGNKVVLGAFVGTFLYSLLIMRTITGGDHGFVPHLSILISIALAMICFGLLIYFIHHVIEILQSETVVSALSSEIKDTINRIYPKSIGKSQNSNEARFKLPNDLESNSRYLRAEHSGYIDSIDSEKILGIARKNNLLLVVVRRPGDFVVSGMPILQIYPALRSDDLDHKIRSAFQISKRRSYVQDIGYGFEQLQLVAIRALSPAVNNQVLGMSCANALIECLASLGEREIPSEYRRDEDGKLRVIAEPVSYKSSVSLALDLVAEAAVESPVVTVHIMNTVMRVMACIKAEEMKSALFDAAQDLGRRSLQRTKDEIGREHIQSAMARLNQITALKIA